MSFWDENAGATFGGAGSGAATGAMLGSAIPGIGTGIGAGAGALLGGLSGFLGSRGTNQAADAQRAALDAAMKRLQQFSVEQQQKRQGDLDKTMAFYQPADSYLRSIYAQPPPAPNPTVPRGPRLGPMG